MKNYFSSLVLVFFLLPASAQVFSPKDYCLVWSDEFNTDSVPNPANWGYEVGYVRNNEAQYYTKARSENARIENGLLIIEAREDNWNGNQYTSASLTSSGKVSKEYGRFEIRAKIDTRQGSWPAFWTLGVSGPWPSNGEIDIMEYYGGNIHANVAWGSATANQGIWDSQTRAISSFEPGWVDSFHVWRMEWTPQVINLYVDDFLMNTTDLSQTINQSTGTIKNPFMQADYIILNQAIGGTNGGDPSGTTFPVRYEIDYVRVYQLGSCHLDCNWQEGGTAYLDDCLDCVGGTTGKKACVLSCTGNMIDNPGFETGDLASWTGWGTRSATTTTAHSGKTSVQVGDGSAEMVIDVLPNTSYTLTAWGEKTGGSWFRLGVKDDGASETYTESTATDWTLITLNFTTGDTTSARIYFYNGAGGTAYGDDFQLQPSGCLLTATQEQTATAIVSLYPNPSESSFSLTVPEAGTVQIFNISGQLLHEIKTEGTLIFGDVLDPGVYTIRYISASGSETLSWVKL
jgi:beta-glucanase (GH16 family)